jgi:phosphatidylglycerol:prolipoprotein diacylglycerol transferase|tara:strand:- start:2019 stop:2801 length:783 start_codon:yes stop_codon:yes gene_type:complete
MYIHNLDPVLLSIGIIEIRWYSLAYIFGILAGWWLGKKILVFRTKTQNVNIDLANFDNLVSYLIISIILGGRLGYVIFYNPGYYIDNPIDIFKIWEGGMSFHGGLIGVIVGTYIFSYKINTQTFIYLDIIACVAPIGLFLGRIANFVNGELFGKPTNLSWSVIFSKTDNIPRHPSQLYEAALEGVLLFIILISLIYNKNIKTGYCSGLFLILYGFFRILSEQFREPDENIGYIFDLFSMGSFLSSIMIIAGIIILTKIKK